MLVTALGAFGIYRFKFGASRMPEAAAGDAIDEEQARERARSFLAAVPLELRAVRADEMTSALATMHHPVWVTLWDTDVADGDEVRIESTGFSTTVTLVKAPATFAIPLPQQGVLNVIGLHDGGGGITVGAMSGARHVALPLMSVGQVLGVPVVVK